MLQDLLSQTSAEQVQNVTLAGATAGLPALSIPALLFEMLTEPQIPSRSYENFAPSTLSSALAHSQSPGVYVTILCLLSSARLVDKLVSHFIEIECEQPTFLVDYPKILSPLAKSHPTKVQTPFCVVWGMTFWGSETPIGTCDLVCFMRQLERERDNLFS